MSEPLNILMTNANYRSSVVGGGQRSVQFLAEGLAEQGHRVTVVSVGTSPADETHEGVRSIRLAIRNLYWPFDGKAHAAPTKLLWHGIDSYNVPMANALDEILAEVRPDVLHTNVMTGFSVSIWRRAVARGIPVVHTLRDYYVVCARSEMFRDGHLCPSICLRCRPFTLPRRKLSEGVDAVVGNSRFILDTHLRNGAFGATPVKRVVYNGYEPPAEKPRAEPRGERLRVGYLGRLAPVKGIEHLLESVQALPADEVEVVVAGRGLEDYEAQLRARFGSDAVHFLGFVAPPELFRRIDLLVVPSLWPEPLPRTVFEAYAHGIPVIGSDRGGIPEIIDEGRTGRIFRPHEEGELTAILAELAGDPRRVDAMRDAAAAKAEEFLPARVVDEYLDVYRTVLDRKARRATA